MGLNFRKIILLIFAIGCALLNPEKSNAQTLYFDAGGGYNINAVFAKSVTIPFGPGAVWTPIKVEGSFGKGWNYGVNVGYFFNDFAAAELGFNELSGTSWNSTETRTLPKNTWTFDESNYATMFRICPAVKFSTFDGLIKPFDENKPRDGGSFLDFYVKLGLVIGVSNRIHSEQTFSDMDSAKTVTTKTHVVYYGGVSSGYNLKLGATFKQSDRYFLFVELSLLSQFYSPSYAKKTEYNVWGVDKLDSLPANSKQLNFVDIPSSSGIGSGYPAQDSKKNIPFSSYSINVGIEIRYPIIKGPKKWK